jgi:phage-related protein
MKRIEFTYYDWNEFKRFLDQLADKDAAKLIATIQNIENNGLIIAERQLWVKKLENNLYEIRSKRSSNIQRAIYFQVQGSQYLITNALLKKCKKHQKVKRRLLEIDEASILKRRTKDE